MDTGFYSIPLFVFLSAALYAGGGSSLSDKAVAIEIKDDRCSADTDQIIQDVLDQTNAARAKKGLEPLVMKEVLNAIAKTHSDNMASKKVPFSHDGFKDRYAAARAQIKAVYNFGENVCYGPTGGREAVDYWMTSKGHRENILGDYTSIGIAVTADKGGTNYFTQVFCKE